MLPIEKGLRRITQDRPTDQADPYKSKRAECSMVRSRLQVCGSDTRSHHSCRVARP